MTIDDSNQKGELFDLELFDTWDTTLSAYAGPRLQFTLTTLVYHASFFRG